ncbi:MAG: hypothetical protein ABI333_27055 [bacterium]
METKRNTRSAILRVAVLGALIAAAPRPALGKVSICASFRGPSLEHGQGYQRLLVSELRHHPTHHVVERGCSTHLRLEFIQIGRGGFLTGQVGGAVPHRLKVASPQELPQKIRELVSFLLKREPVYLVENLSTSGLLNQPKLTLLKHGVYFFGLEFSERILWTKNTYAALPGSAFRFRRAVDRWFLGARISFAYNPQRVPELPSKHFVRFHGTAKVEAGVTFFGNARSAFYLSGLAGVEYFQVYGPVEGLRRDVVVALFAVSLRAGVELLRHYAVRLDLFAMLDLPFHRASDVDQPVINDYTPSIQLGAGIAF